jgi:hypothetical protein
VNRLFARLILAVAGLALLAAPGVGTDRGAAQTETGAICVATFADANGSGQRDPDDGTLAGVNVNLSTDGAIIATHVTTGDPAGHCFESLLPGIYTVSFTDSPTYRATTSTEGTFALDGGQRLTINDFGAVSIPPDALRAEVAAQIAAAEPAEEPLDNSVRLLLSTVGSMVVMIFLIGVGAIIFGLADSRRQRSAKRPAQSLPPTPTQIRPPEPRTE